MKVGIQAANAQTMQKALLSRQTPQRMKNLDLQQHAEITVMKRVKWKTGIYIVTKTAMA